MNAIVPATELEGDTLQEAGSATTIDRAFAGKRVLVTGATGFIGTSLCRRLVEASAQVSGISRSEAAKGASASYARKFHALYDLPVSLARIFMVYGPDQPRH